VTHDRIMVIASDLDIAAVRVDVGRLAASIGFGLVAQTKLVTAASELARNALVHGGGGHALLTVVREEGRVGVRLTFTDLGPGIPDVEAALVDGYSTGTGLGLGLGGSRRLVDEFSVDTQPGSGTTVTVCSWQAAPSATGPVTHSSPCSSHYSAAG
jgi:serine/threonine-protein kinase RsbT